MTSLKAEFELDIVIVGGGMTGSILALALSAIETDKGKKLKIGLIDDNPQHSPKHSGFDARSIALADASICYLKKLKLWRHLSHLGESIKHVHVSDQHHFGITSLNANASNLTEFGQVIELQSFGAEINKLLASSSVHLFCPDSPLNITAESNCHKITLKSGQRLCCSMLVAADGVNSVVRKTFNQPMDVTEFNQSAIIANIGVSSCPEHSAWERFTSHGPIALLPLSKLNGEQRLSLVWAMANDKLDAVLSLNDAEFISKLQNEFGYRAGRMIQVGQRHSYPINLHVMPRPFYHRCLFIGNAAQTLHPIAGQGFNLGFRDVMDLYQSVSYAVENDIELGSSTMIYDYLDRRQTDRQDTISIVESLVRCFSNQYLPLVVGRNLGLRLLSWCPPLKAPVAKQMMGWRNHNNKKGEQLC